MKASLSRKEPKFEDLENSFLSILKKKSLFWKEHFTLWLNSHLIRSLWDYMSRNTTTLNGWGWKWDKMKKGCWTSWICQDRVIELFGCECALFFTKREKYLPKVFQRSSRLPHQFPQALWSLPGAFGVGPHIALGVTFLPQWAWKTERRAKKDTSQVLRANGICLARLWTSLGPLTRFFLLISPLWNGNVYPMPGILEAHDLSGFTSSQLQRNFAL